MDERMRRRIGRVTERSLATKRAGVLVLVLFAVLLPVAVLWAHGAWIADDRFWLALGLPALSAAAFWRYARYEKMILALKADRVGPSLPA